MTIKSLGDPQCELYDDLAAPQQKYNSLYELQEQQCFGVEKLPSRPAGYEFEKMFQKAESGSPAVEEQIIRHGQTGDILAISRNYFFTAKLTRHLDMGGDGGRRDAQCQFPGNDFPMFNRRLIEQVLVDRSKSTSTAEIEGSRE